MEQEIPKPVEKKVDERWYGRFAELTDAKTSEYLYTKADEREAQKKLFVAGEIENPTLHRQEVNTGDLDLKAGALLELKRDIIKNEPNDVVAQAYRWRINEKIAELFLFKSAVENDTRKFRKWSEFIYGKPSKEIFASTMDIVRSRIEQGLKSENSEVRAAAEGLKDSIGNVDYPPASLSPPTAEEFDFAKEVTLNEFQGVIDIKADDQNKTFNTQEIKEGWEKVLNAFQLEGWRVEITKDDTANEADQGTKTLRMPEGKTTTNLAMSMIHEPGTHVLRRENGERSKLMLLGYGFDRYLPGEEGVATLREQVLNDKIEDFAGFESHLAISLSYGYDGKPRDFRGVYETMNKYYLLKSLLKNNGSKDIEKTKRIASNNAWNMAIRIFMGTDYKTAGVCLTKDIVYREGNIGVWDVVRKNPTEMYRFSIGKYDPANARHIWILSQLGISDEDLQANIAE